MNKEVSRVEDNLHEIMTRVSDLSSENSRIMASVMEKRLFVTAIRGSRVYIPPTKAANK
jgi:hypothetical protein